MSRPSLIQAPYHLGHRNLGLGAGVPVLAEALGEGCEVVSVEIGEHANEIAASMAVVRAIAEEVRRARFPVVLAGNCNSSIGTVTGVGGGVGVIWFDAHGDFNTSDTSTSGFFDGMSLAMLTGTGWERLRADLATVPEAHAVHVGGRDFDEGELKRLARSGVGVVRHPPLADALEKLRERVEAVYVHVDLDVLDPSVGRANEYAAEDGLLVDELVAAIDAIHERFEVRAAALTAYNPDCDPEGAIPVAARTVFERLVAKAVAR
jgi:arginase